MNQLKLQLVILLHERFRLIAFAVFVLIVGSGWLLFLQPRLESIIVTMASDLETKQASLQAKTASRDSLRADIAALEALHSSELAALERFLPSDLEVPGLTAALEEAARASGVRLENIKVQSNPERQASEGERTLTETTVTIEIAEVDYTRFRSFLRALEEARRAFALSSLAYTPKNQRFSLSLTAYGFKP